MNNFSLGDQNLNALKMWKFAVPTVIFLASVLTYIQIEELKNLVAWWGTTSKYGHTLLIFPIIAYLIFEKRTELLAVTPSAEPILLPLLILQATALSAFQIIDIRMLSETILVSMYPVIIWLVLGRSSIKILLMPLLLLMTVVPVWELFSPLLTEVTADVAQFSLNALNVPVFRDDNYLTIPEGIFEIADGCGGFRYFIVGLSLGLIHSYLNFHGFKQRAVVIAIAIALAVIANWLRVMIVIWIGHKTNMEHYFVHAHVKLGWYVFGVAFLAYFYLTSRYALTSKSKANERISRPKQCKSTHTSYAVVSAAALATICLVPYLMSPANLSVDSSNARIEDRWKSTKIDGWSEPKLYTGDWSPIFSGAKEESILTYRKGTFEVNVYVAYYLEQEHGMELINFDNSIVNLSWRSHDEPPMSFTLTQDRELTVREIRAESPMGERTIWTWYYISGTETTNRNIAKLLELKKIPGGSPVSAVIGILPEPNSNREESMLLTQDLLSSLYPQIIGAFEDF